MLNITIEKFRAANKRGRNKMISRLKRAGKRAVDGGHGFKALDIARLLGKLDAVDVREAGQRAGPYYGDDSKVDVRPVVRRKSAEEYRAMAVQKCRRKGGFGFGADHVYPPLEKIQKAADPDDISAGMMAKAFAPSYQEVHSTKKDGSYFW